jgi:uncharacterized protein YjbJ (UPF0337 family)
MNKDISRGQSKQVAGKVKETIGKVTGDKSMEIKGATEQVAGKIQEDYGKAKRSLNKTSK